MLKPLFSCVEHYRLACFMTKTAIVEDHSKKSIVRAGPIVLFVCVCVCVRALAVLLQAAGLLHSSLVVPCLYSSTAC